MSIGVSDAMLDLSDERTIRAHLIAQVLSKEVQLAKAMLQGSSTRVRFIQRSRLGSETRQEIAG
jgi:hypothetical protein